MLSSWAPELLFMSEPGPSSSECNIHASKCAGSLTEEGATTASAWWGEVKVEAGCTWFGKTIVLQRQLIRTCLGVRGSGLSFHTLSSIVMSRHITIYRVISVNWHHGAGHGWKQHPYESSVCSITYANNADSWAEMTPAPCFPSPVQMAIKRRKCPFFL